MRQNPFNMKWPIFGAIAGGVIMLISQLDYITLTHKWVCAEGMACMPNPYAYQGQAIALVIAAIIGGFVVGWILQTLMERK